MNHMVFKDNLKLLPVENSFEMSNSQHCFTELKHKVASELIAAGCSTIMSR